MANHWGRYFLPALAIAGAAWMAAAARGATISVVSENQGTLRTTTYVPSMNTVDVSVSSPYGTGVVTPSGGGWVISFSPLSNFSATADNSTGGATVEMDGKITFTLTFPTPTVLNATIVEGGTYATTGNGTVFVNAGGDVMGGNDVVPDLSAASAATTFDPVHDTWSKQVYLGTTAQAFSSYTFALDNDMYAESLGSEVSGSATIAKTSFTIILNPTPLPLAWVGGLGLGALGLVMRKRLAR